MTSDEHKELIAWVAMHVRDEIARALNAQKVSLADAIGKMLAEERARHRELVTRMVAIENSVAPDNEAAVLDLRDERRRRSGNAA